MSNWKDILKTQESATNNNVSIFKPKQGFTLESDNNCCEKFKNKVMDWLERWVIPEYGGHWIDEDCEELYDYLTGEIKEYSKYPNSAILMTKQKTFIKIKKEWDECEGKI